MSGYNYGSTSSTGSSTTTGFQTAYEANYTSAVSQSFISGDGNKTIDGKTWEAVNTAQATTWGLDGSTGLEWTLPSNSTSFDYGTRTSPILRTLITNLFSSFDISKHYLKLTVQFDFTSTTNWDTVMAVFERNAGTGGEMIIGMIRGKTTGPTDRWGMYGGSSGTYFTEDTNSISGDVLQIELFDKGAYFRTGVYSGGFPDDKDMIQRGISFYDNQNELSETAGSKARPFEQDNMTIALSIFNGNNSAIAGKILRLKLEYREK